MTHADFAQAVEARIMTLRSQLDTNPKASPELKLIRAAMQTKYSTGADLKSCLQNVGYDMRVFA